MLEWIAYPSDSPLTYSRVATFEDGAGAGRVQVLVTGLLPGSDRVHIRIDLTPKVGIRSVLRGSIGDVSAAAGLPDRLVPALMEAGWPDDASRGYASEIATLIEREADVIRKAIDDTQQREVRF